VPTYVKEAAGDQGANVLTLFKDRPHAVHRTCRETLEHVDTYYMTDVTLSGIAYETTPTGRVPIVYRPK
jgi:hypothetical protein